MNSTLSSSHHLAPGGFHVLEFVVRDFDSEKDTGRLFGSPCYSTLSRKVAGFRLSITNVFQFIKCDDFSAFPLAEVAVYF